MLNVVATLQQRCGNVLITSENNVSLTLIFDWAQRCDNVVTASMCQLATWTDVKNIAKDKIFFLLFVPGAPFLYPLKTTENLTV